MTDDTNAYADWVSCPAYSSTTELGSVDAVFEDNSDTDEDYRLDIEMDITDYYDN